MKFPGLILLLSLLSIPAACGGVRVAAIEDLEGPVRGGAPPTYLDMVNSVCRIVREDVETRAWMTSAEKVLRRVGEKERTTIPAETIVSGFQGATIRGDGKRYLLLCWKAEGDFGGVPGGGAFVVAVFPEGSARPTDVADVKGDRFCTLETDAVPALGPDDAFAVTNTHGNSNQSYLTSELFHIRGGRLHRIASVSTLSVDGMCEKSFRERFAWGSEEDPGAPYPRVIATVTLERGPSENEGDGCPKSERPPHRESYSETTRWDKAKGRYGPPDRGLEKLDRFNQKNC